MPSTIWQFSGILDQDRHANLTRPISLQDLLQRVCSETEILCAHVIPCDDDNAYDRVEYCIQLPREMFDIVFNSEYGLRGAYFRSPEEGEDFDRRIIEALSPKLAGWSNLDSPTFDQDLVQRSLMTRSAKVWLAELERHHCSCCEGEWSQSIDSDVKILNGRWECQNHIHAEWGRQAHYFSKLKILGAFVDSSNDPYVAPHKRCRSQHIFDWGWT